MKRFYERKIKIQSSFIHYSKLNLLRKIIIILLENILLATSDSQQ